MCGMLQKWLVVTMRCGAIGSAVLVVVSEVVRLVGDEALTEGAAGTLDVGREGGDAVVPRFGRGWRVVRVRVCL